MGKIARKSAKAQENIEIIETALERTQSALRAAEKADLAAEKVARSSRRLFKVIILLGVIGVAVVVVKKLLEDGGDSPASRTPEDDAVRN